MNQAKPIALFVSFSGNGGVERMVCHLLEAWLEMGIPIDLLAVREVPPFVRDLEQRYRHLYIHPWNVRHTQLALPALLCYLRQRPPCAMLAAKDRAIRVAALARKLSGLEFRLVGRLGTHLQASQAHRHPWLRWARVAPMRAIYRWVDHIVAVSEGVAKDTTDLAAMPPSCISVVRNPVVTPRLLAFAAAPLSHQWLADPALKVVLGVGRLTRQKDFSTLLKAFQLASSMRSDLRLIILGEGGERESLMNEAVRLGISGQLDMPGYDPNPYPWMRQADLFVLSSRWEGSPNALTEALALGASVVSTDCPSGPSELLKGEDGWRLVPVEAPEAMAEIILRALEEKDANAARSLVTEYLASSSATQYLQILGYPVPSI